MFPPEDDWLLDYVTEDGEQAEPVNYVPVAPISIMETTTTVAVGWNIECWGRDPFAVIDNVLRLIKFSYPDPDCGVKPRSMLGQVWIPENMSISICKFSPNVSKATEVCFGSYNYDERKNEIHVTQLPLKIWSEAYKCALEGTSNGPASKVSSGKPKELVKAVYDDTGNDKNDVTIKLQPGAYDVIKSEYGFDDVDPIEDYLEIRKQMHCRLNMLTSEGYVEEFPSYESVIEHWYPKRRNMYVERLTRLALLLEFRIDYYKNVLRFILEDADKTINIDKDFTSEERTRILEDHKYTKFNKTTLFQPRYIKSEKLRESIYVIGATYNYIDSITIGEKSQKNIAALRKKIEDLERELEELRKTTWKDLWIRELEELRSVIKRGIETNWLFGVKQHFFKKAEVKRKDKK
jgi:DNA topoisomerase-2